MQILKRVHEIPFKSNLLNEQRFKLTGNDSYRF